MKYRWLTGVLPLTVALVVASICGPVGAQQQSKSSLEDPRENYDWPVYGGAPENNHYSSLAQINQSNVTKLAVAWSFDTREEGGLQTSPLVVNGILYGISPTQKIFALDAATGKLLWKFDSGVTGTQPDRGLSYWTDGKSARILVGVMNFLYALDTATGKPIATFGEAGRIDLRKNLNREPFEAQSIYLTSPGVVYQDLIIVGGRQPETLPAPPGDVRAFDVRTGKLRWAFHTIPHPGEFGENTWPRDAWKSSGGANNWSGMSLDSKRGLVYVPTGSAAFDFYGGDRLGDDLFANCLIALNAETGERVWHFQAVRHDLWDRDFPSPPALLTVKRGAEQIDAVAQITKHGYVYLFNRANGETLFPIEFHKYPASAVPGETAATEQPLPTRPAPFARQSLDENQLSNRTPAVHHWALEQFRKFRNEGQFVPFSIGKDTLVFPGFDGGAEWGGPAVDAKTGVIYINSNDVAWTGALAENTGSNNPKNIYLSQCGVCHGDKLQGSPPAIPALTGIRERLHPRQIAATIKNGKGRMPGFPNLTEEQLFALIEYLTNGESKELENSAPPATTIKYRFTGYKKFLDPDGFPAVAPPWGTLNAIDLNTGEYVWRTALGELPELTARGLPPTGTENYGGPIVTGGGLVFIAATKDEMIRAFDQKTGRVLWQTKLSAAGYATPSTYMVNGRQFVVIACGGGKSGTKSGDAYVAFALSKD
jgi:quinoprotein glucose dehydrogenase